MTNSCNERNRVDNYTQNSEICTNSTNPNESKVKIVLPLNEISKESTAKSILEIQRKQRRTGKYRRCCTTMVLVLAAILFLLGLLTLRFTLFDIFMQERLRMRPGLMPFEWWKDPEPEVRCRIYIFTVTNHESFLNQTDSKIKLKEIGPIVYRERIQHSDIVFHENSTMSYTIHRFLEFLPERNEPGVLNKTIIVPNIVLLGMAAYLADYPFTIKFGFRIMSQNDRVFVNTTIYNYLWNFTTPAFLSAKQYVPFMVVQDNGGAMYNVYKGFKDRVNVRMGTKYGYDQFFMIDNFNGRPTVPGYKPEEGDCFASLQNSSEGALYPNFLTKNSVPTYWRKTVCRPILLFFEKEVWKDSIRAYKYIANESLYDRNENLTADCYSGTGGTTLPDGLSDVSKCYNDLPVAVSAPHFYGRDGYWTDYVEGFAPSKEKHGSFAILEPKTGVPMEQVARSQSNMVMPKLSFFNEEISRFSGAVVPMVWVEYHQEKLTLAITAMLIFTVNILPVLQYIISGLLLIGSGFYLTVGINRLEFDHRLRHMKEPTPKVSRIIII